jgi:hypothetical protein
MRKTPLQAAAHLCGAPLALGETMRLELLLVVLVLLLQLLQLKHVLLPVYTTHACDSEGTPRIDR